MESHPNNHTIGENPFRKAWGSMNLGYSSLATKVPQVTVRSSHIGQSDTTPVPATNSSKQPLHSSATLLTSKEPRSYQNYGYRRYNHNIKHSDEQGQQTSYKVLHNEEPVHKIQSDTSHIKRKHSSPHQEDNVRGVVETNQYARTPTTSSYQISMSSGTGSYYRRPDTTVYNTNWNNKYSQDETKDLKSTERLGIHTRTNKDNLKSAFSVPHSNVQLHQASYDTFTQSENMLGKSTPRDPSAKRNDPGISPIHGRAQGDSAHPRSSSPIPLSSRTNGNDHQKGSCTNFQIAEISFLRENNDQDDNYHNVHGLSQSFDEEKFRSKPETSNHLNFSCIESRQQYSSDIDDWNSLEEYRERLDCTLGEAQRALTRRMLYRSVFPGRGEDNTDSLIRNNTTMSGKQGSSVKPQRAHHGPEKEHSFLDQDHNVSQERARVLTGGTQGETVNSHPHNAEKFCGYESDDEIDQYIINEMTKMESRKQSQKQEHNSFGAHATNADSPILTTQSDEGAGNTRKPEGSKVTASKPPKVPKGRSASLTSIDSIGRRLRMMKAKSEDWQHRIDSGISDQSLKAALKDTPTLQSVISVEDTVDESANSETGNVQSVHECGLSGQNSETDPQFQSQTIPVIIEPHDDMDARADDLMDLDLIGRRLCLLRARSEDWVNTLTRVDSEDVELYGNLDEDGTMAEGTNNRNAQFTRSDTYTVINPRETAVYLPAPSPTQDVADMYDSGVVLTIGEPMTEDSVSDIELGPQDDYTETSGELRYLSYNGVDDRVAFDLFAPFTQNNFQQPHNTRENENTSTTNTMVDNSNPPASNLAKDHSTTHYVSLRKDPTSDTKQDLHTNHSHTGHDDCNQWSPMWGPHPDEPENMNNETCDTTHGDYDCNHWFYMTQAPTDSRIYSGFMDSDATEYHPGTEPLSPTLPFLPESSLEQESDDQNLTHENNIIAECIADQILNPQESRSEPTQVNNEAIYEQFDIDVENVIKENGLIEFQRNVQPTDLEKTEYVGNYETVQSKADLNKEKEAEYDQFESEILSAVKTECEYTGVPFTIVPKEKEVESSEKDTTLPDTHSQYDQFDIETSLAVKANEHMIESEICRKQNEDQYDQFEVDASLAIKVNEDNIGLEICRKQNEEQHEQFDMDPKIAVQTDAALASGQEHSTFTIQPSFPTDEVEGPSTQPTQTNNEGPTTQPTQTNNEALCDQFDSDISNAVHKDMNVVQYNQFEKDASFAVQQNKPLSHSQPTGIQTGEHQSEEQMNVAQYEQFETEAALAVQLNKPSPRQESQPLSHIQPPIMQTDEHQSEEQMNVAQYEQFESEAALAVQQNREESQSQSLMLRPPLPHLPHKRHYFEFLKPFRNPQGASVVSEEGSARGGRAGSTGDIQSDGADGPPLGRTGTGHTRSLSDIHRGNRAPSSRRSRHNSSQSGLGSPRDRMLTTIYGAVCHVLGTPEQLYMNTSHRPKGDD